MIRGPSVASGAESAGGRVSPVSVAADAAVDPRSPGARGAGSRRRWAAARLLATSWVIVATTDHVSDLEARTFAAVNDLPDALWPVIWAPMQLGSLAGSLVVVVVTCVSPENGG